MQLRGARLKEYLEGKLGELVASYAGRSKIYIYSQKEFALYASVSRETVRKYQAEIDAFLTAYNISKRSFDKDARVNNLESRVLKLQCDLMESQAMYEAIRVQYLDMIESLLANSIDVQALICPSVESSDCEKLYKQCVLCGMSTAAKKS